MVLKDQIQLHPNSSRIGSSFHEADPLPVEYHHAEVTRSSRDMHEVTNRSLVWRVLHKNIPSQQLILLNQHTRQVYFYNSMLVFYTHQWSKKHLQEER